MARFDDTIAALATPAGTAALAVLRITGTDTERIARELAAGEPRPRVARHRDYRALGGELLDDVVLTFFRGPHSYTGEDALEISCHGNPLIAQKILEDLLARGCRAARPGEFTQRAFLNGRMDLSQAEAVMDLIHARSERALAAANQQLRGGLGRRMAPLIDGLLRASAQVEAYIDFPDEDLPMEDRQGLHRLLADITLNTNRLLATSHYGELLRDGVRTVIAGPPNAGKSSLLNRLVGRERAIVSPEPGTTRDYLEERIMIGPHCLRLIDTAGLNPSPAPLEKLGMEKTFERLEEADLLLLVVDAAGPLPSLTPEIAARFQRDTALVVLNKADLVADRDRRPLLAGIEQSWVSALTGEGLEGLRDAIVAKADAFATDPQDQIAINARHAHALTEARTALAAAQLKLETSAPAELLASDLRTALAAFGEITGRIDNERVLDALFATFCIGK